MNLLPIIRRGDLTTMVSRLDCTMWSNTYNTVGSKGLAMKACEDLPQGGSPQSRRRSYLMMLHFFAEFNGASGHMCHGDIQQLPQNIAIRE